MTDWVVSASALASLATDTRGELGALQGCKSAWEALFNQCVAEPSTSFEWTVAMLRHHLAAHDGLALMQVHRGDTLVGCLPLVTRTRSVAGRRIAMLTPVSEVYNTHGSVLVRDFNHASAYALVAALLRLDARWDAFRISKVLENSGLPGLLQTAAHEVGLACEVRYGRPAYFLRVPTSYKEYLRQRSQKFRNHLNRTTKKLLAAGRVEVSVARTEADFDCAYDALLAVERASWKHVHGTAISAVPHQAGFYRTMGRAAAACGRLHLQVLTLDSRPVAHNLGYLHCGRYYYLKTSFHEAFRSLNPSTFLRARLIEQLINEQVELLDFPGEPYDWERQWTSTYHFHQTVTIYNRTSTGRALAWLHRMRRNGTRRPAMAHCDPRQVSSPRA